MASSRARDYQGWPILAASFRPFFLLAAIQAALAIMVWLPAFHGELRLASAFAPRDWHVHEMLYGYLPAVVTGFLFTAIPNWTGRLPLRGTPLLALVVIWLAGRLCVTFSAAAAWWVIMLVDTSFLSLVAAAAAREIIAGRNWRNLMVVMLVAILLAGNVAFHVEAHVNGQADISIRIGIAVVVLLISLIGGRIIPSFTRNWLVRENPGRFFPVRSCYAPGSLCPIIARPVWRWRWRGFCILCACRAGLASGHSASGCLRSCMSVTCSCRSASCSMRWRPSTSCRQAPESTPGWRAARAS
jgi:uncharacterized protein involved in response to NO